MDTPQQIIDTGTASNDGTGESLRLAFTEVNNNFANVWAAGPVNTNVVIRNNVVSTGATNLDIEIAGNGIGNITLASTTVPKIGGVYDIGSSALPFSEVHAQYFYGNGAFLTGINGGSGNGTAIANGRSNVVIAAANANVTVGVNGVANVAVFANNSVTFRVAVLPNIANIYDLGSASQRWRDLYLSGNSLYIGNARLSSSNAELVIGNVGNLIASGFKFANGMIAGAQGIQGTQGIQGISGPSTIIDATEDNATANLYPVMVGATGLSQLANATPSKFVFNAATGQLSVTGNVAGNNFYGSGEISVTGNLIAGNIASNDWLLGNTVSANTVSAVGNINSGNLLSGGSVSAVGNLFGSGISVSGNVDSANVSVTGNITGGNVLGGANVNATTHTGSTVSVTGNVTGGNILTGGLISATGNITGGNILGGANVNATTHTGTTVSVSGNVTGGNLVTAGAASITGNLTVGNGVAGTINLGDGSFSKVSGSGWYFNGGVTSQYVYANSTGFQTVQGNATNPSYQLLGTPGLGFYFPSTSSLAVAVASAAVATFSSTGVSATANVTAGNLLTAGLISATGNITGGNILGGANVNATTHTGTTVSVSGNVTGGNLVTAGLATATGNVQTSNNVVYANTTGSARAYQFYNSATASLDTVFL